jgi:hypothetical protein
MHAQASLFLFDVLGCPKYKYTRGYFPDLRGKARKRPTEVVSNHVAGERQASKARIGFFSLYLTVFEVRA